MGNKVEMLLCNKVKIAPTNRLRILSLNRYIHEFVHGDLMWSRVLSEEPAANEQIYGQSCSPIDCKFPFNAFIDFNLVFLGYSRAISSIHIFCIFWWIPKEELMPKERGESFVEDEE